VEAALKLLFAGREGDLATLPWSHQCPFWQQQLLVDSPKHSRRKACLIFSSSSASDASSKQLPRVLGHGKYRSLDLCLLASADISIA